MADISKTACPNCASLTLRFLDGVSRTSVPDYYRCDRCTFVFLCPKGQSGPMQGSVSEPQVPSSLPVRCRACQADVRIELVPHWRAKTAGPALTEHPWTCPHCGTTHSDLFPGRVVRTSPLVQDEAGG